MTIIKTITKRLSSLLVLVALSTPTIAEVQPTNDAFRDIGKAYGFHLSQNHSLNEISKKYPALSRSAQLAQLDFQTNFLSSIHAIEAYFQKHLDTKWDDTQKQLVAQIKNAFDADHLTQQIAKDFISEVHQRAKGDMPSPIVETLLMFKPGYEEHPHKEYLDGFQKQFSSNGEGKAKGVAFSIKTPKSWLSEEANRPNIVQKFTNQNGRGNETLMVIIKELNLPPGMEFTEEDVRELTATPHVVAH